MLWFTGRLSKSCHCSTNMLNPDNLHFRDP
jgi:hypothetical protein